MAGAVFDATIRIRGVNPSVDVPAELAARLRPGWRRPMPVLVRVNGKPGEGHRINLMPAGGGGFTLYLNAAVRRASSTGVGDRVAVELELDREDRSGPQHPLPEWFAEALERAPDARASWGRLAPSRRKGILRSIAGLKSPEARARNLERAMRVLSGQPERFMARSWRDGPWSRHRGH